MGFAGSVQGTRHPAGGQPCVLGHDPFREVEGPQVRVQVVALAVLHAEEVALHTSPHEAALRLPPSLPQHRSCPAGATSSR